MHQRAVGNLRFLHNNKNNYKKNNNNEYYFSICPAEALFWRLRDDPNKNCASLDTEKKILPS
jgi:hypothetical protein